MSTITLSSSLVKKLTSVLSELTAAVESASSAPAVSAPAPATKAAKAPAAKKSASASSAAADSEGGRAPRGSVKEAVIAELKAAGKTGASVTDLAEKLNTKAQNLYTWFNQTGKKIPQIKKFGRGTYRYVGR